MLLYTTIALALANTLSATRLYVSSYAGIITTLDLTETQVGYNIQRLTTTGGCSPNATWLHLDTKHHNLYCLDEGSTSVSTNGSLTSFKIDPKSGSLRQVQHARTFAAPVYAAIYTTSNGTQLLAIAHYASAFTTWKLDPSTASFTSCQNFTFNQNHTGPITDSQSASHPHQVSIDPLHPYLLILDLGSDCIRIYHIDASTLELHLLPPFPVSPGSGPRHGVFVTLGTKTSSSSSHKHPVRLNYYLITELSSTLTGYHVHANPDGTAIGLTLTPFTDHLFTLGNKRRQDPLAAFNRPAEIAFAPGNHLLVSNRNFTAYKLRNPQAATLDNNTPIPSDSLATFSLHPLRFEALDPAGGLYPRSFAFNKNKTLVVVGLQWSDSVVVYRWCGHMQALLGTKAVARFEGLGNVTSVVWGE
ncbi:MAG: hypothetical protein LQ342_005808 [Letrouitia transgressa]|nr:MAG: hypothetical protein LQ342_005808 [Letrouitia transgressa]